MMTLGVVLAKRKTPRAAVIPYLIIDDVIYFLLGTDKVSGDLTDLGGGVKKGEFALLAALREFREESDEVFGDIYHDVNQRLIDIAVTDEKMSVLFLPVGKEWYKKAPQEFAKRVGYSKKKAHDEISELVWVKDTEFRDVTSKNGRMWRRLKCFYSRNYTEKLLCALKIRYALL